MASSPGIRLHPSLGLSSGTRFSLRSIDEHLHDGLVGRSFLSSILPNAIRAVRKTEVSNALLRSRFQRNSVSSTNSDKRQGESEDANDVDLLEADDSSYRMEICVAPGQYLLWSSTGLFCVETALARELREPPVSSLQAIARSCAVARSFTVQCMRYRLFSQTDASDMTEISRTLRDGHFHAQAVMQETGVLSYVPEEGFFIESVVLSRSGKSCAVLLSSEEILLFRKRAAGGSSRAGWELIQRSYIESQVSSSKTSESTSNDVVDFHHEKCSLSNESEGVLQRWSIVESADCCGEYIVFHTFIDWSHCEEFFDDGVSDSSSRETRPHSCEIYVKFRWWRFPRYSNEPGTASFVEFSCPCSEYTFDVEPRIFLFPKSSLAPLTSTSPPSSRLQTSKQDICIFSLHVGGGVIDVRLIPLSCGSHAQSQPEKEYGSAPLRSSVRSLRLENPFSSSAGSLKDIVFWELNAPFDVISFLLHLGDSRLVDVPSLSSSSPTSSCSSREVDLLAIYECGRLCIWRVSISDSLDSIRIVKFFDPKIPKLLPANFQLDNSCLDIVSVVPFRFRMLLILVQSEKDRISCAVIDILTSELQPIPISDNFFQEPRCLHLWGAANGSAGILADSVFEVHTIGDIFDISKFTKNRSDLLSPLLDSRQVTSEYCAELGFLDAAEFHDLRARLLHPEEYNYDALNSFASPTSHVSKSLAICASRSIQEFIRTFSDSHSNALPFGVSEPSLYPSTTSPLNRILQFSLLFSSEDRDVCRKDLLLAMLLNSGFPYLIQNVYRIAHGSLLSSSRTDTPPEPNARETKSSEYIPPEEKRRRQKEKRERERAAQSNRQPGSSSVPSLGRESSQSFSSSISSSSSSFAALESESGVDHANLPFFSEIHLAIAEMLRTGARFGGCSLDMGQNRCDAVPLRAMKDASNSFSYKPWPFLRSPVSVVPQSLTHVESYDLSQSPEKKWIAAYLSKCIDELGSMDIDFFLPDPFGSFHQNPSSLLPLHSIESYCNSLLPLDPLSFLRHLLLLVYELIPHHLPDFFTVLVLVCLNVESIPLTIVRDAKVSRHVASYQCFIRSEIFSAQFFESCSKVASAELDVSMSARRIAPGDFSVHCRWLSCCLLRWLEESFASVAPWRKPIHGHVDALLFFWMSDYLRAIEVLTKSGEWDLAFRVAREYIDADAPEAAVSFQYLFENAICGDAEFIPQHVVEERLRRVWTLAPSGSNPFHALAQYKSLATSIPGKQVNDVSASNESVDPLIAPSDSLGENSTPHMNSDSSSHDSNMWRSIFKQFALSSQLL